MISKKLRQRIAHDAKFRCGYCLTQEIISGIPLTLEHITPRRHGGQDSEQNLWVSCRLCNEAKGSLIAARDPDTDEVVPLFNPRTQTWAEHFVWREDSTLITGLTPVGRATVEALSLNTEFRIRSRKIWVEAGYHPPD